MKKNFKYFAVIWAILLALFNVICFVTPDEMNGMSKYAGAFWVGYIFITAAFVGQLICAFIAFKAENIEKMFYNVPLISLSFIGLIVMAVVGALTMAIPNLPNWIGIIVCAIVLAFTAIAVVKASMAADNVQQVEQKVKAQTFFIKSLTVDADTLLSQAKSDDIKAECRKVYEAVRYSDPMSNDALAAAESQITLKFSALSDAVKADNTADVKTLASELLVLIADRNKKCKLLK